MEIIRTDNPQELAGATLSGLLLSNRKRSVLLMLSGGSAFSILDYVDEEVLGPNIVITVLDERLSIDPNVNNFMQLEQTAFCVKAAEKGARFISTEVTLDSTVNSVAAHLDLSIRVWREQNPNGVVIATMGIGPDGHTAGIFPGTHDADFESNLLFVGYEVSKEVNQHTQRITATHSFLRECVDEAIVYAVGTDKQIHIKKLEEGVCDTTSMPACVMVAMKSVTLYTKPE